MPKTTRKISVSGLEKKILSEIDISQRPINPAGDTARYFMVDITTKDEMHYWFGSDGNLLLVYGFNRDKAYDQYHDVVRFVDYNKKLPLPEFRRSEPFGQLSGEKEKIARFKRQEAYEIAASLLKHLKKPHVFALKLEVEALDTILKYGQAHGFL